MRIIKYSEKNVNNGFMTSKQKINKKKKEDILINEFKRIYNMGNLYITLNKYIFQ